MNVVIAHEWLTNIAGSEQVVQEVAAIFPEARMVFGIADPKLTQQAFPGRRCISLIPSSAPGILAHWHRYAPLLMAAWRRLRLRCDLLIVSNHFSAHQLTVYNHMPAVVYYHTPMRFAWRFDLERDRFPRLLAPLIEHSLSSIQAFDRRAGRRPGLKLANSTTTAARVKAAYGISPTIVHPPVRMPPKFQIGAESILSSNQPFFLVFGRLVAYKRVQVAVEACTRLNVPLIVAGRGPLEGRLRKIAGESVRFVGRLTDTQKWHYLAQARALLFPGEEDFGIVPVEALASGTPVIALKRGGISDIIENWTDGILYENDSAEGMMNAINVFLARPDFSRSRLEKTAQRFSPEGFRRDFVVSLRDHGVDC